MRAWAVDDDLWVRRTAVLCQLNHRADTDADLLHDMIEPNVADRSFWLRKAIGWALREYAKTDPDWVRAEVDRFGRQVVGAVSAGGDEAPRLGRGGVGEGQHAEERRGHGVQGELGGQRAGETYLAAGLGAAEPVQLLVEGPVPLGRLLLEGVQ